MPKAIALRPTKATDLLSNVEPPESVVRSHADRSNGRPLLSLATFGKVVAVMWMLVVALLALALAYERSHKADDPYFVNVSLAFLIWVGLCVWLISRRRSRVSLRGLFVIMTGCALIAGAATYYVKLSQETQRHETRRYP